jgi:hypothetical protein
MAELLIGHDLATGDVLTTIEVDAPDNVRLSWKTTDTLNPSLVVKLQWYIYSGAEDYHHMKDPRIAGKKMTSYTLGDESSSEAMVGINATKMKINLIVPTGSVGAISLWTI